MPPPNFARQYQTRPYQTDSSHSARTSQKTQVFIIKIVYSASTYILQRIQSLLEPWQSRCDVTDNHVNQVTHSLTAKDMKIIYKQ